MDNINPGSEERTASNKVKLLLYVNPSQTNSGSITSKAKDLLSGSSLLQKITVVGGAALILTNIILTTLASLKVFGIINFL
jgi:hypothetical protein